MASIRTDSKLMYGLLLILFTGILGPYGCSDEQNASVSTETGSIDFNVVWQTAGGGDETSYAAPQGALTGNPCQDFGITTVVAKVYTTSDVLDRQSPYWNCSNRGGTISSVSAGQRYVVVEGYVQSVDDSPEWRGQSATIQVIAGQTNTDLQDHPIGMSHTSDNFPPTILATNPIPDDSGVATNTSVTVEFSEALVSTTIDSESFYISTSGGDPVSGNVFYNADAHIAIFMPTTDLAPLGNYTVTILGGAPSGVADLAGNFLTANYSWDFTTSSGADTVPPTVAEHTPVGNNVVAATAIRVSFSEPMNPDSITDQTFLVSNDSADITGSILYQAESGGWSNVATFDPAAELDLGTAYSVTIVSGGSGVKDLAGNPMQTDYTWNFTTASSQPTGLIWDQGNWDETVWN